MAKRPASVWLLDIRSEIAGIRDLMSEVDENEFAESWAMMRAVQHALLIIAEASKHIPAELKARRPEVPWSKIHGLGNLLRHEYRRVDPTILFSVVTEHLDTLDAAAAALLAPGDDR